MITDQINRNLAVMGILTLIMLVSVSCKLLDKKTDTGETLKPLIDIQEQPEKEVEPVYYDFKDILVPGELKEEKKFSSVTGTGNYATGFLVLYGRVELRSVVHFFKEKTPEGGWRLISAMKSPFSHNLLFQKKERWCLITLEEKGFGTKVTIGVSTTHKTGVIQ